MKKLCLVTVTLVLIASSCTNGPSESRRQAIELISREAGNEVSSDDPRVEELTRLIDSLVAKCGKSDDDMGPDPVARLIASVEVAGIERRFDDPLQAARAFDSFVPEDPPTTCRILADLLIMGR